MRGPVHPRLPLPTLPAPPNPAWALRWSLKSRSTVLWHLGHLGSSRDSITYIMHRGHPARIIDAPPPPPPPPASGSGLPSDDTHELGGDAEDEDDDDILLGELLPPGGGAADGPPPPLPPRDREKPSRRSSFGPLPLFLLIFDPSKTLLATDALGR